MIKLIVGLKGAGKTAQLVEEMNLQAVDKTKDVVCVVRGKRLETQIKPQIRLIDISEYPTKGYREFLSFLAGICAKDYDLTDIYIDSISKVANAGENEQISEFLPLLESFANATNVNFTIILTEDPDKLSDVVKKYIC
ncbi:MAG: ATP-binding protein [Saccharofermentanales bacterium]